MAQPTPTSATATIPPSITTTYNAGGQSITTPVAPSPMGSTAANYSATPTGAAPMTATMMPTPAASNVGSVPPDMRRTIVVLGATGQQGAAVIDSLLSTGRFVVRAVTRDVSSVKARDLATRGCELVSGDMEDATSMERVMQGAYGVFSVQTPFVGRHVYADREIRQGKNVIDAAKKSNIRHLVYSSVSGADRAPKVAHFASKGEIEAYLKASGVPYTILRPTTFMENWLHGPTTIRHGKVMTFASDTTKNYFIATADIGAFAELSFSYPEESLGRSIDLAGDHVDGKDLCLIFNRVSPQNAPFKYVPVSRMMLKMTSPEMHNMSKWLDESGFNPVDIDALRRRHPGLRTVEMWAVEKGFSTRQLPRVSCDIL